MNKKTPVYFKEGSNLPEIEQKWCRCILHVAAKQNDGCLVNVNTNAKLTIDGRKCYNPYAVCSTHLKPAHRRCGINYEFRNIPTQELRAYTKLNKINVPPTSQRDEIIATILAWKLAKYKFLKS
jgi:hypothetical protein